MSGTREFVAGYQALRAEREQLTVQAREGLGRTVVGTQPQHDASPVHDQPPGAVDQLLKGRQKVRSGRLARINSAPGRYSANKR